MPSFQIVGLDSQAFEPLFDLSDAQLQAVDAARRIASSHPGYPCRVSLQDADVGEELILLNHTHHDVASPYRASGPIYVRRGAQPPSLARNQLPDSVTRRLISVRAYDLAHGMVSARVAEGRELFKLLQREFQDSAIAYVHLHNAGPGCYACKAIRAGV